MLEHYSDDELIQELSKRDQEKTAREWDKLSPIRKIRKFIDTYYASYVSRFIDDTLKGNPISGFIKGVPHLKLEFVEETIPKQNSYGDYEDTPTQSIWKFKDEEIYIKFIGYVDSYGLSEVKWNNSYIYQVERREVVSVVWRDIAYHNDDLD